MGAFVDGEGQLAFGDCTLDLGGAIQQPRNAWNLGAKSILLGEYFTNHQLSQARAILRDSLILKYLFGANPLQGPSRTNSPSNQHGITSNMSIEDVKQGKDHLSANFQMRGWF